ncbi:citrate-binding protein, partial [Quercus suber]
MMSPMSLSRNNGYDYSSGVWQFEGYVFVPNVTTGVCIMQVFGASPPATTMMLIQWSPVLVPNIYDRWFRLNVIHDVDASDVKMGILWMRQLDMGENLITSNVESIHRMINPIIWSPGYDYSSGVWQFEGYVFVPNVTTGVCIMQVFGASPPATTMMLIQWSPVLVPNIYDRWFRLNVIHDVDASDVKVYTDGNLVDEAAGHGGKSYYIKCG